MPALNHTRPTAPAAAHASKAARPATAHHSAVLQHPGAVQRSNLGHGGVRPAALTESDYVANPYCERCGTDEFIYLETFVPATHRRDGSVSKLGEVTYFCSGCDDFSAHAVPASWVPPGWYFG